jgi:hypothetical protein
MPAWMLTVVLTQTKLFLILTRRKLSIRLSELSVSLVALLILISME